ncbi:hypothetical protein NECAME_11016 [Necator americanus]|uniref:Uncharacterized protein n=1 Tax=Necator americanus TaxID=51031 RepID=W2T8F0_NECAM|nr:hypothetical protein NECAME_11016 [Necator americanus]ETN77471.1 hypothetical protein NECAME_11016 [Necator americanus]
MSATVFYDFPFHPLVLDYTTFLLYCKLAEQRTKCYVEQCKDTCDHQCHDEVVRANHEQKDTGMNQVTIEFDLSTG